MHTPEYWEGGAWGRWDWGRWDKGRWDKGRWDKEGGDKEGGEEYRVDWINCHGESPVLIPVNYPSVSMSINVSEQLLNDSVMPEDWLGKIMRGEGVKVSVPVDLTWRQKIADRTENRRFALATWIFEKISGCDLPSGWEDY